MSSGLDADVLVIGAGISGLTAATRLKKIDPELKVLVLEASDRVGGRTLSHHLENDALDLGAHWVTTAQPIVMKTMAQMGIGHYPQNVKGKKVLQVGDQKVRTYSSDIPNLNSYAALIELDRLIKKIEKLAKEVDIRDPYAHPKAHELDSTSVEGFVRANCGHESVYHVFNAAMQACLGCDCSQVSPLFFLAYANGGGGVMKLLLAEAGAAQEFKVKGGTQEISKNLAKDLGDETVLFSKEVSGISEDGDVVTVSTRGGESYTCSKVISAMPAYNLNRVEFSPPLPQAKRELLKNMPMGNLAKVYIVYEKSFWLDDGFSGEVVATGGPTGAKGCEMGPASIFYDATTSNGTPILVGFLAGKNADQWFAKSAEERKAAVLKQLVDYFGPKARDATDYVEHNWSDFRHLGGGPACRVAPGAMHNFYALRAPHGRIHFAGTEVATSWPGYMEGAMQAGLWAAASVVEDKEKLGEEDRKVLEQFKHKRQDYGKLRRDKTKNTGGTLCAIS